MYIALCNYIITICISITSILTIQVLQVLLKSGDIETNLGPKKSSAINLCLDFVKVPLIEAFINAHNFDIVWLPETFLDSRTPHNDGYLLLKVGHPNNIKQGGVCMYFKKSFPLIRQSDLSNMKEFLVTKINVNNETCFFYIPLYRSPIQIHEELEIFVPI